MKNIVKIQQMKERIRTSIWRLQAFLGQAPPQLVVCGFPRGGTSLLYNMLSATLMDYEFTSFECPASTLLRHRSAFASKWPMDILNLQNLVERNTECHKKIKVIIVIRDPRDVITSRHPNVPDRFFCSYIERWSPRGKSPNYDLVETQQGVRAVYEGIEKARKIADIEIFELRFEDLLNDADAIQIEMKEKLKLNFANRFSEFTNLQDRHAYRYTGDTAPIDASLVRENSPVDKKRSQRWKDPQYALRIRQQFLAHPQLFQIVRELGYESDDSWFNFLGVKSKECRF